ncbi:hypothetical protein V2O64_01915 [Verrucomicrobiaceae bacterium 227]
MSSTNTYLCPSCDRNVPVGKNCPCSRPKRKERKPKITRKSRDRDEDDEQAGIPEDNFDYDDFIAREFGTGKAHKQVGIAVYWWITALVLALAWLFLFIL